MYLQSEPTKKFDGWKVWAVTAAVLILIVLYLGIGSATGLWLPGNNETLQKFALGMTFLVPGFLAFGFKAMGIGSMLRPLYRSLSSLILLVATILSNSNSNPVSSWHFDKLDPAYLLATGFWEEVFFRTFLLYCWHLLFGLKNKKVRIIGVIVCSFIFGFGHTNPTFDLAFMRSMMGIILSMVYLNTRSLLLVALLHAVNNGAADVIGGHNNPVLVSLELLGLALISLIIIYRQPAEEYIYSHEGSIVIRLTKWILRFMRPSTDGESQKETPRV